MKVVLFCGGLGMRLREYSDKIPKPMVPIGDHPILWHLMKYYAHHGHKDFILCLGYRSEVIKQYFLSYSECLTNDFVLSNGGTSLKLLNRDISDWTITFVDTGLHTNIAGRLMAVREHLEGDDVFLANYADGLCDFPLNEYVAGFLKRDAVATFVCVKPTTYFHIVSTAPDGTVRHVQELPDAGIRMNGGFFVFRKEVFSYIREGEELVREPFQRLIEEGKLVAHHYDGFWRSMDTFKDKQALEDLLASNQAPWQVWKNGPGHAVEAARPEHRVEAGHGAGSRGASRSAREPVAAAASRSRR